MPRRSNGNIVDLYGGGNGTVLNPEVNGGLRESKVGLQASTRPDYGGTPVTMLQVPRSYQDRVQKAWSGYDTDAFFARLINRSIEFCANGSRWDVPTELDERSWMKKILDWRKPGVSRSEREEVFWSTWSAQINQGVPNTLPGLDTIVGWAVKHLLLSGMFVPHWELGTMRFGKQDFLVPTRMTCYPASAITLVRQNSLFMEEEIQYRSGMIPKGSTMREGAPMQAPESGRLGGATAVVLPQIGEENVESGSTEATALKYLWTPGDLSTMRTGQGHTVGAGVYPRVPFFALTPQLLLRQKMFAADLSILDGVINYIMKWSIGDKEHPPVPPQRRADGTIISDGTIGQVRKLLQEGRVGPALEVFLPYYVNLEIKMPDTSVLLSERKYIQSTIEIFSAFGIFLGRAGGRDQLGQINVTNFEEFIEGIRMHVAGFLQMLASRIVELNPGKLRSIPTWIPNPINTKNEKFLAELHNMLKIGRISTGTMLRYLGLNENVEKRRIAQDLATDADELYDDNVPMSYVQEAVGPGGGRGPSDQPPKNGKPNGKPKSKGKRVAISPSKQPGRPPKGQEKT